MHQVCEMPLDVFQQVFTLSLVSNLVGAFQGTQTILQRVLQAEVTSALPRIGAHWRLAWGPVVWKSEPDNPCTGPDDSWYIAFNPRLAFEDGSVHPTYVIAIAGTAPGSAYAWFQQNFAVDSVSNFNAWVAGGIQNLPVIVPPANVSSGQPHISTGTVRGVHVLLTTRAPKGAASAGKTLLEFITHLKSSGSPPRVIATGHSLGGTLSPSLALALVSARILPVDRTLTYPTAGASPGDIGFSDLFVRTLPARKPPDAKPYQGWNLNLVNTLDVVPQAWCTLRRISPRQHMGNIPSIYGHPAPPLVLSATLALASRARRSGALYKPLPSQYITGPRPLVPPRSLLEFLLILGPQHVQVYVDEVGVGVPAPCLPLEGAGLGEKTEGEMRLGYPVIAEFEWAYEHPEEAEEIMAEVEGTPEWRELALEI